MDQNLSILVPLCQTGWRLGSLLSLSLSLEVEFNIGNPLRPSQLMISSLWFRGVVVSPELRSFLVGLRKGVRYGLAAVDGADENKQSSASDDEAKGSRCFISFLVCRFCVQRVRNGLHGLCSRQSHLS